MLKYGGVILIVIAQMGTLAAEPRVEWIRTYGEPYSTLYDIFDDWGEGWVLCGRQVVGFGGRAWVLQIEEDGEPVWQYRFDDGEGNSAARSIIRSDNGGYIIAGAMNGAPADVSALRLTADGERRWIRDYGGDNADQAAAVVELKEGNFVLGGVTTSFGNGNEGYLVTIDDEGRVIWSEVYGGEGNQSIAALRESEGGIVCAGVNRSDFWLFKVDYNGELIWERTYSRGDSLNYDILESCYALTSCPGGFALAGRAYMDINPQNRPSYVWVVRTDMEGNLEWERAYHWEDLAINTAYGILSVGEIGFVVVGRGYSYGVMHPAGYNAGVLRLNGAGDVEWMRIYRDVRLGADTLSIETFNSAVLMPGDAIVACGSAKRVANGNPSYGVVMRLAPERSAPFIVSSTPLAADTAILRGDSLTFEVVASDLQQDTLFFSWLMNDELLQMDTLPINQASRLGRRFLENDDYFMECEISDGELAVSIAWTVHVRELFISVHQPDTLELTVRRNESVDFSIEVEAVEGEPVNYRWTIEGREVGDESQMSYQFRETGDYFVWVDAFRDDAADSLQWLVHVRSTVRDFWPDELQLRAPVDTTILFGVEPFDPGEEEMLMLMLMDGDTVAVDTFETRVNFEEVGEYDISYIVLIGEEADTIRWEVSVYDPLDVQRQAGMSVPLEFGLLPPLPNPFNSRVTLSFALPQPDHIRLVVFDISGRIVEELAGGQYGRGEHSVIWNAGGVPAGIYFARLEAGGTVLARKLALVR